VPYADLHTHTHCSDGRLSPTRLVEAASERGIRVLSVTDHDTVAGLEEADRAAKANGITLVPGVELSVAVDGNEIHLLAYGFDPEHAALVERLDALETARIDRMRAMLDRLHGLDVPVSADAVQAQARDAESLGRPHLALALKNGGYVETVQEAFDRYIGRGGPAFVAKPPVPASDVLTTIHDAGGIGVLAHPGHWTPSARLRTLIEHGLDGIETIHPSHDDSLESYYERWARSNNLVGTGGSDYHGHRELDEEPLGRHGLTRAAWKTLQAVLEDRTVWGRHQLKGTDPAGSPS